MSLTRSAKSNWHSLNPIFFSLLLLDHPYKSTSVGLKYFGLPNFFTNRILNFGLLHDLMVNFFSFHLRLVKCQFNRLQQTHAQISNRSSFSQWHYLGPAAFSFSVKSSTLPPNHAICMAPEPVSYQIT
jgi:hypothetical protein